MKVLQGISGLLSSRKGTLSVLLAVLSGGLAAAGKIDGTSFAAVIGTVATIFMWTAHKVDIAALKKEGDA